MLREIWGTFAGRWYVTIFGATFAWCALRQLGWRRTLTYTALAVTVGALAENGSVRFGIPYTHYSFNESLRGRELFVGDVPLMVPLSYTFMIYFAFGSGRLLASGPLRTRGSRAWHEWLLALMLAVWALWILDPVSRLGEHFYLGDLFRYDGPGFWFGLPAMSQAGFAATAAVLLTVLFRMDRAAPDVAVSGLRKHPHLPALLTYHGQVFHLAIVGFWLGGQGVSGANTIAGAAVLIWVPAACLTAVHWSASSRRRTEPSASGAEGDTEGSRLLPPPRAPHAISAPASPSRSR